MDNPTTESALPRAEAFLIPKRTEAAAETRGRSRGHVAWSRGRLRNSHGVRDARSWEGVDAVLGWGKAGKRSV